MRKDAERNRLSLIEAASSLIQERGADVPMEAIAAQAGVTRGTLYRNFSHRYEMYEAVLEHELRMLNDRIAADGDSDPLAFIRWLAEMMIGYDRFLFALARFKDFDLAGNHRRIVETVSQPLLLAQRKGLLDPKLSGDDVVLCCRMLSSNWRLDGFDDSEVALTRRFNILVKGIGISPAEP